MPTTDHIESRRLQPCVLLVDDDETTLTAMARTLGRRYRVITATRPAQALARLRDGGGIDAIVSDLQMPQMNGITFLQAAGAILPRARRILLSGHCDLDATMAAVNRAGVARILSKPTSAAMLAEILEEVIDRPVGDPAEADGAINAAQVLSALAAGEFTVRFEPKVPLAPDLPAAFDARPEWRPANGRIVPAHRYLAIAERAPVIDHLSDFVLEEACRACAGWSRAAGRTVVVSLALPPPAFARPRFADAVGAALARHALPSRAIEIGMRDGVSLPVTPIPRQGQGRPPTALSPGKALRIDGGLVRRLPYSHGDAALVRAIVSLARRLGLRTVAEDVETEAQADCLSEIGCDYLQGPLAGQAMTAAEVETWMKRDNDRHTH